MAKQVNQRMKLLHLDNIFHEKTDKRHGLTINELIDELKAVDIAAERKSLYQDIRSLRDMGREIELRKEDGAFRYFLTTRTFDLLELKILVDTVQASKFLTERKSRELIQKLEGLSSRYEAGALRRQVLLHGRIKHMNESIYYNVDKIHEAIMENAQLRFKYFRWNIHKEPDWRREGAWYVVSPWQLCLDDENYYLIAYDSEADQLKHYRVDKMKQLELVDEKRLGLDKMEDFDAAEYTSNHFGMYGGEKVRVTLEAEHELVGVVLDRFGMEVPIIPLANQRFRTHVKIAVSDQFLGWVAGFGGKMQITSPKEVCQRMAELVKALAAQYVYEEKDTEGGYQHEL